MTIPFPKLTEAEQKSVCAKHPWAAFHTPKFSKHTQIFEIFDRSSELCDGMREKLPKIPRWSSAPPEIYMPQRSSLRQFATRCGNRTQGHTKQLMLENAGLWFRDRFYLFHCYKVELSKTVKFEMILPPEHENNYASKLEMAAETLLCLEAVTPDGFHPLFPSTSHDVNFDLVRDSIKI